MTQDTVFFSSGCRWSTRMGIRCPESLHRHRRVVYTELRHSVSKVSMAIDDAGAKDSAQGADD